MRTTTLSVRSAGFILALALGAARTAAAQPPPVSPQDFVNAAAGAGQYEVSAARVALTTSRDPKVRAFAEEMVRDHGAALAALGEAATRSGLEPPQGVVGADQAPLLAALQGSPPSAFDRTYVRQQILAHSAARAVEGSYAREGRDPNLRRAAAMDLSMIERHLAEAKTLSAPSAADY